MRITDYNSNQMILEELGQRIRDNRIAANYSQMELAERAGLSVRTLASLEKGHGGTLENLLNVLRALGSLSNLELLLPEQSVSPISIVDRKPKPKRASRSRNRAVNKDWVWGEDRQ
ncbi:MAG: helix-turn-helix domain-containing protein [Lachnospiraceae bacterium]|nr:helix-turn-helix domain-containing protein [Lachnospiraceae bacterium]